MTLKEYSDELSAAIGNPGLISEIDVRMSSDYGRLTDRFIELELNKALFFDTTKFENPEKALSDQATLSKYARTNEGKEYITVKMLLKGLEKMMAACRNHTFVKNQENKGQW